MSSVNFIATAQPSVSVTSGKSAPPQADATAQSQPAANSSSSVTFSSSGTAYANYEQIITEKTVGQNQVVAYSLANPTSPLVTQNSYDMAHGNLLGERLNGVFSLHSLTRMDAPISYTNGEPVTVASQTYYTQQATIYQNQALQLYNTEKAKGTTPGQIVSDIYDLQAKQPDAFRAMNAWPPASGPTSIQDATNIPGVAPQYLNASEEIINSSSSSSSNYDQLIAQAKTVENRVLSNIFDSLISSSAGQQTVAASQPQPSANSSSTAISSDATRRANREQQMAETAAGYAQMRINNVSGSNLTSPMAVKAAYDFPHANLIDEMGAETGGSGMVNASVGYDLRGTLPGGDGILRYANGGEPVTPESQAYWKQQATSFQNQALQLYNSEAAKGTPPGEILNKYIDLQIQQPERFRSMMMWPSAADIANNSAGVIYGNEKSL